MNPVKVLREAIVLPFQALFVVGICTVIDLASGGGVDFVHWVALGMGIAVVCAWWRALKLLAAAGVLAAVATAFARSRGGWSGVRASLQPVIDGVSRPRA